ncbi:protein virilizer homolog [Centruroides sculpturatus]|uniref:protein virilizer homolog n=1 Tax=Centruroides sculpturatus TaxID=218467 RepID=UPI000C6CC9F0|nr:protein virilizer homolog [Centruroides sculpturatus]
MVTESLKSSSKMDDDSELLFFDTFSHENSEELNLDLVQFPRPVYIHEIRIIPLGARVQADFPGGHRLGATNPSTFQLEFFVNDLSTIGACTFKKLGNLEYKQNVDIQFLVMDKIPTDGLVLRGWYCTITLAVYGMLTKVCKERSSPPPPPPPPQTNLRSQPIELRPVIPPLEFECPPVKPVGVPMSDWEHQQILKPVVEPPPPPVRAHPPPPPPTVVESSHYTEPLPVVRTEQCPPSFVEHAPSTVYVEPQTIAYPEHLSGSLSGNHGAPPPPPPPQSSYPPYDVPYTKTWSSQDDSYPRETESYDRQVYSRQDAKVYGGSGIGVHPMWEHQELRNSQDMSDRSIYSHESVHDHKSTFLREKETEPKDRDRDRNWEKDRDIHPEYKDDDRQSRSSGRDSKRRDRDHKSRDSNWERQSQEVSDRYPRDREKERDRSRDSGIRERDKDKDRERDRDKDRARDRPKERERFRDSIRDKGSGSRSRDSSRESHDRQRSDLNRKASPLPSSSSPKSYRPRTPQSPISVETEKTSACGPRTPKEDEPGELVDETVSEDAVAEDLFEPLTPDPLPCEQYTLSDGEIIEGNLEDDDVYEAIVSEEEDMSDVDERVIDMVELDYDIGDETWNYMSSFNPFQFELVPLQSKYSKLFFETSNLYKKKKGVELDYDIGDETWNYMSSFNPFQFELVPLQYFRDPSLTSFEVTRSNLFDKDNSQLTEDAKKLLQIIKQFSDKDYTEKWVEAVETIAVNLLSSGLASVSDDNLYNSILETLLNWVEEGLNFDAALKQSVPVYKVRHMKAGIRLAIALFQTDANITNKLLEKDIPHKLLELYDQQFMALPIKLLILRAIDASTFTKQGMTYFIQKNYLYKPSYAIDLKREVANSNEMNCNEDKQCKNKLESKTLTGYQKLLDMLMEKQSTRAVVGVAALMQKVHLNEVLQELRDTVEKLVQTTGIENKTVDSSDSIERQNIDTDSETAPNLIEDALVEVLTRCLSEITRTYKNARKSVAQQLRYLPARNQFNVDPTPFDPHPGLYRMFQENFLLESIFILVSSPATSAHMDILTAIKDLFIELFNSQPGILFLMSNPDAVNGIHRALMQVDDSREDSNEDSINHCLGMQLICHLQALQLVDTLLAYHARGGPKKELDDPSAVSALHHLYTMIFDLPIGRTTVVSVLSVENNLDALLPFVQMTGNEEFDTKLAKSVCTGYATELLILTVQCSERISMIENFAEALTNLSSQEATPKLHELALWMAPTKKIPSYTYEAIGHLMNYIKTCSENAASLPPDLITALRILQHVTVPNSSKNKEENEELKYKYAVIQVFSNDGLSCFLAILQKICDAFLKPSNQSFALVGIQGILVIAICKPVVILLQFMLQYLIYCRGAEFKDLTAVPVLLRTHLLMSLIPMSSFFYAVTQQVQSEIVETLLAYTQPYIGSSESEEALSKSLWTKMIQEVLKFLLQSPNTFTTGLSVFSELLPLPLPLQTREPLLQEEVSRAVNCRKLWSAHLHSLSPIIQDIIISLSASSCHPLQQLLRRVCVQLSDLATPTAVVVVRAVLDALLDSFVPNMITEEKAEAQGMSLQWEVKPCSTAIARILNLIAYLVSHAPFKIPLINILRGSVKTDEKYSEILNMILDHLNFVSSKQSHINSQECIVSILQSLCDPDIGFVTLEGGASVSEVLANSLPPKEHISEISGALIQHIGNHQHTFASVLPSLRTLVMLTEHDFGFFYVKQALIQHPSTLRSLFARLSTTFSKDSSDCLSTLSTTLEFLRLMVHGYEETSQPVPARTLVLSTSELRKILDWYKFEQNTNNNSSEKQSHPLFELERLLTECSTDEEALESLLESVSGFIQLLSNPEEDKVEKGHIDTFTFTALSKSLWTKMIQEVLKFLLQSPNTFTTGLSVFSELLPLPLPLQTREPLLQEEVSRAVNCRKLWSAHLHSLSPIIQDIIISLSASSCHPLQQLLRRVCVQLSDLATPTAVVVVRAVLDALLDSFVPNMITEEKAEAQGMSLQWEVKPCSTAIARILNLIAYLVSHAPFKIPLINILRGSVKTDEKYSEILNMILDHLNFVSSKQSHINSQECIVSILQSLCDPDIGFVTLEGGASVSEVLANSLPPKEHISEISGALIQHIGNHQHTFASVLPSLRTLVMLTEHDFGFFYVKQALIQHPSTLRSLFARLSTTFSKDSSDCLSTLSTTLEFLRLMVHGYEETSQPVPARTLVLSTSELRKILDWFKFEQNTNNNSSEKQSHPLFELERLLTECSTDEEALESLLESVSGFIQLLSNPEEDKVEKEILEPTLPPAESQSAQFAVRPVYIVGEIDEERLSPSYWLAVPGAEETDQEVEQIPMDLIALSEKYWPDFDLKSDLEKLCLSVSETDTEVKNKKKTRYVFSKYIINTECSILFLASSCHPLQQLLRRVCVQLSDLATPTAVVVVRAVLDALLDSFVPNMITEEKAEAQGMSLQWEVKPCSTAIARILNLIAYLVSHAPFKIPLINILRGSVKTDEKYSEILNMILDHLNFVSSKQSHINSQECIVSILQSLCDPDIGFVTLEGGASVSEVLANSLPPKEHISEISGALIQHIGNHQHTFASVLPSLRTLVMLTEHDFGFFYVKQALIQHPSTLRSLFARLSTTFSKDSSDCLSTLSTTLEFLRLMVHGYEETSQPVPARTLVLSTSELRKILDWFKFEQNTNNNSSEKQSHPLFELERLLTECSTDEEALESLLESVSGFIQLLSNPEEDKVEKEILEPTLPPAESQSAQFAVRPVYIVGEIDEERLSPSYWLAVPGAEETDQEVEQIPMDLIALSEKYWPDFDLKSDLEKLCLSVSETDTEVKNKKKTSIISKRKCHPLVNPSNGETPTKKPFIAPMRGRGFGRGTSHSSRANDPFRSRPPNTSRPPSMHVDDFLALEHHHHHQSPSSTTSTTKRSAKEASRGRGRGFDNGRAFGSTRGGRFFSPPGSYNRRDTNRTGNTRGTTRGATNAWGRSSSSTAAKAQNSNVRTFGRGSHTEQRQSVQRNRDSYNGNSMSGNTGRFSRNTHSTLGSNQGHWAEARNKAQDNSFNFRFGSTNSSTRGRRDNQSRHARSFTR